mgnify:CR=1 FL=1
MNVIVTGATQGLGLEIAKTFVKKGHNVAICGRNMDKLEEAREELRKLIKDKQKIITEPVDVSNEEKVETFINYCLLRFKKIDVLINNAGIYGPFGKIEETNSEEWKECIDINLIGPFYFMKNIISHMKENKYGKIINISGGGATQPLPFISAYAASKTAIVRLTESIAEEVKDYNIDVNSIAPGLLNTRLFNEVLEAGPEKVGENFYNIITKKEKTPLSMGANLCYWLASKKSDGITGRLISAVWDDYEHIDKKKIDKDLYMLRRIVK